MATIYVDSNASGANDGTSWTDAYTSPLSTTGAAAGDLIKVEYRSAYRHPAGTSPDWSNGTRAGPIKIISVDKDNSDAYRPGAVIGTVDSGYHPLTIMGNIITYGITWEAGYRIVVCYTGSDIQYHEDAIWKFTYGAGGQFDFCLHQSYGAGADYIPGQIRMVNCTLDSSAIASWWPINISAGALVRITGLTISGTAPTSTQTIFIKNNTYQPLSELIVEDSDLSIADNLFTEQTGVTGSFHQAIFRRCKLKAGATVLYGTKGPYLRFVTAESCDDGTITVPPLGLYSHDTYFGKVSSTLSRYRTGGADDGEQANAYSWEMTTNANALEIYAPLESPPLTRWVEPDASISGATAQGIFTSTRCEPLATPTALTTDGTSTWNGSGVGTKQKIEHTLTNGDTLTVYVASGVTLNDDDFWIEVSEPDQVGGPVTVRCFLAKPSTTVYVDPRIEVA